MKRYCQNLLFLVSEEGSTMKPKHTKLQLRITEEAGVHLLITKNKTQAVCTENQKAQCK